MMSIEKEIVEKYKRGVSGREIAKENGMTYYMVYKILRESGEKFEEHYKRYDSNVAILERIIEEARDTSKKHDGLGVKYGISNSLVKKELVEHRLYSPAFISRDDMDMVIHMYETCILMIDISKKNSLAETSIVKEIARRGYEEGKMIYIPNIPKEVYSVYDKKEIEKIKMEIAEEAFDKGIKVYVGLMGYRVDDLDYLITAEELDELLKDRKMKIIDCMMKNKEKAIDLAIIKIFDSEFSDKYIRNKLEKAKELIQAGAKLQSVAKIVGIGHERLSYLLKESGYNTTYRPKIDNHTREKIVKLKSSGKSTKEISNEFGVSDTSIYRITSKLNKETDESKETLEDHNTSLTAAIDIKDNLFNKLSFLL